MIEFDSLESTRLPGYSSVTYLDPTLFLLGSELLTVSTKKSLLKS